MRILFCLLLSSIAFAQELPCAKLLENLPSSSLTDITTIDVTFQIHYVENGPDAKSTLHYVKDFVGNRTYIEHNFGDGRATYHYQNGVGSVTEDGETKEAPREEDLVSVREMMELLEFDLQALFASDDVESCDGQQTYGELVSGEQVTALANGEKTSFIFDDKGQFLAIRSYFPEVEGILLSLFADYAIHDGLLQRGVLRFYELKGDEAVLQEERILEVHAYNQSIDETLLSPLSGE